MRLPTVIIRDVLRVNSDEDIVRSLRTQNRHLSEGLDWDKVRPVYATGDGRAMTLSATRCSRRPVWDQSPLVQCSRCLGYGHGKRFAKKCPRGARTAAGSTLA
ncbi:hypothetical protein EVAR_48132_1 [Eumeta japonica]|uniref:Uncharacterized protein n=1 Tax=Eumeta variegata TaxID=151549 RepID=A0A4C2ABC7_EUMVA|nr:hypothetical protein EVAR_48132_1 [Eumeta japonica]